MYIKDDEYSERFDEIRQKMMHMSYFKYGSTKINYPNNIDAIASLEKRLEVYKTTGNTEYLCDIANFAMIEFMYPRHAKAKYIPTDSNKSIGVVGFGVGENNET